MTQRKNQGSSVTNQLHDLHATGAYPAVEARIIAEEGRCRIQKGEFLFAINAIHPHHYSAK